MRVYSRTDGKYYYVAHYTDVYKSTTITFDAPRGTTDLKLVIDGTTYYAQAGTTLTVSGGKMFVIADSWYKASDATNKTYYQWPVERTMISSAYNGTVKFSDWVKEDVTTNTYWYRYPSGSVCRPIP